ncbi:MAG: zinc carboxypeptidase [Bacteroidia bacterium]|nr:MAG: zinc carboxypeptidase [Bacteroidia bacterium]
MKKLLFGLTFLLIHFLTKAQLQSPQKFLGYELGTQFTPHYKLVAYAKHVADNSKMVSLKHYGTTNEGRELLVLFIGTESNISNLSNIQSENISLTKENGAAANSQPALVWLSYNVHGNEPTSSEAALQTLYDLVDPSNAKTKEWLKNTVVVIDPCLNPDGRDRYVNWYNSMVGKKYNVNPYTREHMEPWPRGRSNHYYFDLNRDWAWQTQVESQQRMALYNSWLPQVHVDFHEQGYNEPYYFAPAAEPMHDVLTKWQRDFQVTIGKNHASYFDKEGWLFFTKERFDLFYPSYGDTYPLYNGAIGMTYEQGGINAGLGVITNEGDTLTFVERVAHHVTTGLSTIEISSKNASKLVSEFKKYFQDSYAGKMDSYKTYVVKYSPENAQKLEDLKALLQKNKIEFKSSSSKASLRGFNYFTKKDEGFSLDKQDVIISSNQSKSALVRVLFEPESRLTDSVTYDITAWAIPYVYGLPSYAVKSNISGETYTTEKIENKLSDAYGYVFGWSGMQSAQLASALMQKGIKLKVSDLPFSLNGKEYAAGSILILKGNNQKLNSQFSRDVAQLANQFHVPIETLSTGMVDAGLDFGSQSVRALKMPNIVVLSGASVNSIAVGEVWSYFDNILKYPVSMVNVEDVNRINWAATDVLILPEGGYGFLMNKTSETQLQNWIKAGGKLIAMEGALMQLSQLDWVKLKSQELDVDSAKINKIEVSNFAQRERKSVSSTTPGAIFKVDVDNTHPLMFGYPKYYYTLKQSTNIFKFKGDEGWNVGVIKDNKQVAGFVGEKLGKALKNGVVFAVQDYGKGQIISFADNILFRNFWNNGNLVFANAVFLVGQ